VSFRLYLLQRLTEAIMAPLILAHVALIFYATRQGLSAADIFARTKGSVGWAAFYGVFVVAAAVHGAIGLRTVLAEWGPSGLGQSARALDASMWGAGLLLAGLGLRAVYAVTVPQM
jgi:fumarate reductase subunit C